MIEDEFVLPCAVDGCKQPSQMPASEYCLVHSAIGTKPHGGEFAVAREPDGPQIGPMDILQQRLDAAHAENRALREALRSAQINSDSGYVKHRQTRCNECERHWNYGTTESHAPACLAAPQEGER